MSKIFNIYCDESGHLLNDQSPVMTLGLIRCPLEKTKEISIRLREIKQKHKLPANFEIKWNKVSETKLLFYLDVVDYFFDDDDLFFRAVIANKNGLIHDEFAQTHDDWYYKMMFLLINTILNPEASYRIYLDKKDTRSGFKVCKLHEVLCNSQYDFDRNIIQRVQVIESHAVEQLQLADLLIGAVGYVNRGLSASLAKNRLIERIKQRSRYDLNRSTLRQESKFNLFQWQSRQGKSDYE